MKYTAIQMFVRLLTFYELDILQKEFAIQIQLDKFDDFTGFHEILLILQIIKV